MRTALTALVVVIPALAGADEPRILDGRFQLSFATPMCVRAPCPAPRWSIRREGLRVSVARMELDPATPAPLQAAVARAAGLNPSVVEGRIRIEGGTATILLREFTTLRRR